MTAFSFQQIELLGSYGRPGGQTYFCVVVSHAEIMPVAFTSEIGMLKMGTEMQFKNFCASLLTLIAAGGQHT